MPSSHHATLCLADIRAHQPATRRCCSACSRSAYPNSACGTANQACCRLNSHRSGSWLDHRARCRRSMPPFYICYGLMTLQALLLLLGCWSRFSGDLSTFGCCIVSPSQPARTRLGRRPVAGRRLSCSACRLGTLGIDAWRRGQFAGLALPTWACGCCRSGLPGVRWLGARRTAKPRWLDGTALYLVSARRLFRPADAQLSLGVAGPAEGHHPGRSSRSLKGGRARCARLVPETRWLALALAAAACTQH